MITQRRHFRINIITRRMQINPSTFLNAFHQGTHMHQFLCLMGYYQLFLFHFIHNYIDLMHYSKTALRLQLIT